MLVFLLKGEVTASIKPKTKLNIFNSDNTKEEKEGLCVSDFCFRRKGRLENKKSIS